LLLTSFPLSIVFTCLFVFNYYYYHHHHHHHHHCHYPILFFVSISNPFILLFLLFLAPFCYAHPIPYAASLCISPFFFYFLSFSIFFFFSC
jgi:hypothetical protein